MICAPCEARSVGATEAPLTLPQLMHTEKAFGVRVTVSIAADLLMQFDLTRRRLSTEPLASADCYLCGIGVDSLSAMLVLMLVA